MKLVLLAFVPCICCLAAKAQGTGDVYAAPGMSVKVQRGVPVEPIRVRKPFLTEVLPRYWLISDSIAREKSKYQVIKAIQSRLKFPKVAMINGVRGRIYVRALISPEGEPIAITITGRSSTLESVSKEVVDALDAETIRVIGLLRFEPKSGVIYSLTIPMGYFFE